MTVRPWNEVYEYIETHLYEELVVEELATVMGYSPYHFHHLFTKNTQCSFGKYIRTRRLANASSILLFTDLSILDLSLMSGFQSQEAFTRAFKKMYTFAPASYRKQFRIFVEKERKVMKAFDIPGWFFSGNSIEKFDFQLDKKTVHSGTQSLRLSSLEDSNSQHGEFATALQSFSADHYVGERVKVTAYMQTEITSGWAGIWIRIDGESMAQLKFDNMQDRPVRGTTRWQPYSCVVDVPNEARIINIGALFEGEGSVWFDDFSFEKVDKSTPVTDEIYPMEPSNLFFEL